MTETELKDYYERLQYLNSQIKCLSNQKYEIHDKLEAENINCPYCKHFHKLQLRGSSYCEKTGSYKSGDYPKCFVKKEEQP